MAHPVSTGILPPLTTSMVGDVLRLDYPHDVWTIRSWASMNDYITTLHLPLGPAEPGHACIGLDALGSPSFEIVTSAGQPVAVRETWRIAVSPDDFMIEQEVRPVGDSFAGASLAIMLRVTNLGTSDATLGARLLLNPDILVAIGGTTSPFVGFRGPGPTPEPLEYREQEWIAPSSREWDMYGHPTPSTVAWLYHVGG